MKIRKTLLIFIVAITVISCRANELAESTPTEVATTTASSKKPASTTTSTPSPIIEPTLIPSPTLSEEDTLQMVEDLLTNNAGCRLPCWWGITPGHSNWQEAYNFLEPLAVAIGKGGSEERPLYTAKFEVPENIYSVNIYQHYTVKDGIVEEIELSPGKVPTYTLSAILNEYGRPTEVYIATHSAPFPEGVWPFIVYAFYPDHGILAVFDFDGEQNGSSVQACSLGKPVTVLYLWAAITQQSFIETTDKAIALRMDYISYLSLTEATNIGIDEFYKLYKDSNEASCIESPLNLWNPQ